MPEPAIVVIGGSAGALQALTTIAAALPSSLSACLLVVIHTRAESNGMLPEILGRETSLPVEFATHRAPLKGGRIYVARPDFQLLVSAHDILVVHGPRENGFRPAIDPLFRTAARAHGPRVIGVILSGALDDGTHGLNVVKQHGGIAIVQDPEDAVIPTMPASALQHIDADYVLRADQIADVIDRLTCQPAEGGQSMVRSNEPEQQLPSEETEVREMEEFFGAASALTCPDCGGALWEIREGKVLRYKCHVGHQFAPESLLEGQRDAVESALWSAVRVLEEHAELRLRLAKRAAASGMRLVSKGFAEGARNSRRQAQEIRGLLFSGAPVPESAHSTEVRSAAASRPRAAGRSVTMKPRARKKNRQPRRNG